MSGIGVQVMTPRTFVSVGGFRQGYHAHGANAVLAQPQRPLLTAVPQLIQQLQPIAPMVLPIAQQLTGLPINPSSLVNRSQNASTGGTTNGLAQPESGSSSRCNLKPVESNDLQASSRRQKLVELRSMQIDLLESLGADKEELDYPEVKPLNKLSGIGFRSGIATSVSTGAEGPKSALSNDDEKSAVLAQPE